MSDIIINSETLGRQIADEFVTRLKGLALTTEEAERVNRVAARIATAVLTVIISPGLANEMVLARDLDLTTLGDISLTKGIKADALMRQSAYDVCVRLFASALKFITVAAVASSGS